MHSGRSGRPGRFVGGRRGSTRPLDLAPVCCGCTRQGVTELAYPENVRESSFRTRPTKPEGSTHIGICLMSNLHGTLRREERICGHTPCPRCLARVEEVLMCPCYADRTEARGSPLGGVEPQPDGESHPGSSGGPEPQASARASGAACQATSTEALPVGSCIRYSRPPDGACCAICEGSDTRIHTPECDAAAKRDHTLEDDAGAQRERMRQKGKGKKVSGPSRRLSLRGSPPAP